MKKQKKIKKIKIKKLPKKVKRNTKGIEEFASTTAGHKWAGFSY